MPSHLRQQSAFAPFSAHTTSSSYPHITSQPPQKRQRKMTVTETYRLVHSARGKLTREAQRNEHDLRLLVGHANLLDSLMIQLEEAEDEQQSWFHHQTTKQDSKSWATATVEEHDLELPDASDEEDDSDSDVYEDEPRMAPIRTQAKITYTPAEDDDASDSDSEASDYDDDMSEDEDALNMGLALCRTISHSEAHPPELVHDSDDSDDDMSPPSPPQSTLDFSTVKGNKYSLQKMQQPAEAALYDQGFYIPNQPTLIAAC